MRVKRGEHGTAPESKSEGNGRSARKPAEQRHRPARFPHAKIRERPFQEFNPVRLVGRRVVYPLIHRGPLKCVRNRTRFSVVGGQWSGQASIAELGYGSRRLFLFPELFCGYVVSLSTQKRNPYEVFCTVKETTFLTLFCLQIAPDDAAFPPHLHSSAALFSPHFTITGSQDLVVKKRPNLSTHRSHNPMRVIEENTEWRRNEGAGETGDPRENPPTNGIVRHDSRLQKPARVITQRRQTTQIQKGEAVPLTRANPLSDWLREALGTSSASVSLLHSATGSQLAGLAGWRVGYLTMVEERRLNVSLTNDVVLLTCAIGLRGENSTTGLEIFSRKTPVPINDK
ncbi:hypothetical protein PR048_010016 [Dryococelus australis]|uniref:Uncharacterized protein n=1 Tax=Dryococelus australis TaxID=614101 RepID=A0ABQ9I1I6_9NEOP|nr:hypothetical protein PR048_010016 [Dryococelus australis]